MVSVLDLLGKINTVFRKTKRDRGMKNTFDSLKTRQVIFVYFYNSTGTYVVIAFRTVKSKHFRVRNVHLENHV